MNHAPDLQRRPIPQPTPDELAKMQQALDQQYELFCKFDALANQATSPADSKEFRTRACAALTRALRLLQVGRYLGLRLPEECRHIEAT